MMAFNKIQRVLHKHSLIIQSGLYAIKNGLSYPNQFEHIKMLMYMNPLPNYMKYDLETIPPDFMKDPITHIPLIENTELKIRTKMIVWKPGAILGTHYHGGDDCFFQPMYPVMIQTIWQDRMVPITTLVHTHKYSYISDAIGPHSMTNTHKYDHRSNVSFHLYIGEDFYDDGEMCTLFTRHPNSGSIKSFHTNDTNTTHSIHSCMSSDPDLYWYANKSQRV